MSQNERKQKCETSKTVACEMQPQVKAGHLARLPCSVGLFYSYEDVSYHLPLCLVKKQKMNT